MIHNITTRVVAWIIGVLGKNETFKTSIKAICHDYYVHDSLKFFRVWGDPARIKVGAQVHLNNALFNTVSGNIVIGDYTFFGHSVSILTGTHDCSKIDLERQTTVPESGRNVVIGKGVWVASNVTIIGPCHIGDYSAIGVGAVVIGDVEARSFYAGIPAKFIKKL
jgi:acetyltransferase-like isoleucine patch superfamily enzyme